MDKEIEQGNKKVFNVSLVYTRLFQTSTSHALRSIVVYADNEDEALGCAMRLIEADGKLKDWQLYLKAIIEFTEFTQQSKITPSY